MALVVLLQFLSSAHAYAAAAKDLRYSVFLDGDKIGYHKVNIRQEASTKIVQTEARFNVKFLFFNAYAYQHTANEVWNGRCLRSIRSKTDDNGDELFLYGHTQEQLFKINSKEGSEAVTGCVKSFAYWDADLLLTSEYLLNSQNGQYTPVQIVTIGNEEIQLGQKRVNAIHYQIVSDKFTIDLWYSQDKEWLALSTRTENGSTLRYEREEG
jgi:hypothetical protein